MKASINKDNGYFTVYINDLPHLSLKISEVIHFQSWISSRSLLDIIFRRCCKYNIEYYTKNGTIQTNYSDIRIWIKILKELKQLRFTNN